MIALAFMSSNVVVTSDKDESNSTPMNSRSVGETFDSARISMDVCTWAQIRTSKFTASDRGIAFAPVQAPGDARSRIDVKRCKLDTSCSYWRESPSILESSSSVVS